MASSAAKAEDRPYVETSLARWIGSRIHMAHEERGICVIAGPYGIGKTTAIDAFENENEGACAVVKVEPMSQRGDATPIHVMQLAIEGVRRLRGQYDPLTLPSATWQLRQMINRLLIDHVDVWWGKEYLEETAGWPKFTFIFDEAQYLSKKAIEMLRFWNDRDRTLTPFPVGLVFIGNNEFALREDGSGESALSGAVRSRALFVETLDHSVISDTDITLFLQSRRITDGKAIGIFLEYLSRPRVQRDLRQLDNIISIVRRRSGDKPVTADVARSILMPG